MMQSANAFMSPTSMQQQPLAEANGGDEMEEDKASTAIPDLSWGMD